MDTEIYIRLKDKNIGWCHELNWCLIRKLTEEAPGLLIHLFFALPKIVEYKNLCIQNEKLAKVVNNPMPCLKTRF